MLLNTTTMLSFKQVEGQKHVFQGRKLWQTQQLFLRRIAFYFHRQASLLLRNGVLQATLTPRGRFYEPLQTHEWLGTRPKSTENLTQILNIWQIEYEH